MAGQLRRDRGDGPAHRRGCSRCAGVAFSALQPPGSTMKIITATGRARGRDRQARRRSSRSQTAATIDGFTLQNANGEACGGTFLNAFAVSCNSVFAPLGAKLGGAAPRRDRRAVRLQPAAVDPGRRREPTIPSAATIGDALAVGSSAIGQGMVQATRARDDRRRGDDRDGRPAADPDAAGPPAPPASCTSRQAARRPAGAADDDRGGAVRHRDVRADPGGARSPARPGTAELQRHHDPNRPQRQLAAEHRRVVRRLRAGGPAADRGRRAVPRAGRRRRRRRPRCTTCSTALRPTRGAAACARGSSTCTRSGHLPPLQPTPGDVDARPSVPCRIATGVDARAGRSVTTAAAAPPRPRGHRARS